MSPASSALPATADTAAAACDVRKSANTGSRRGLFDHLVGASEESRWDVEAKRLRGLEVDDAPLLPVFGMKPSKVATASPFFL